MTGVQTCALPISGNVELIYTATGPGSVRKVLRRRESLQLVMEVLSSDGEKIL